MICGVGDEGSAGYTFSERHLQCIWCDERLRPGQLRTTDGEELLVEYPGRWNLEAGPDFLGAAVYLGPQRRRVVGDVEIHIRPDDWCRHNHGSDKRYSSVKFHVTYYPGPVSAGVPSLIHVALKDYLSPFFSFGVVDLSAYPYAWPIGKCAAIFKRWSLEQQRAFLKTAGWARVCRRAEVLASQVAENGLEQTFYEEFLAALGYKHNKWPCRLLARQLPLDVLRREASGDYEVAYALLLGVGGLMPSAITPVVTTDGREMIRRWWDIWWRKKCQYESTALHLSDWRFAGVRPTNNPLRRLMGAAAFFIRHGDFLIGLARGRGFESLVHELRSAISALPGNFWDNHLSLSARALAKKVAIIGPGLVDLVVLNLLVPLCLGGRQRSGCWEDLGVVVRGEPENAVMRQTVALLFGEHQGVQKYPDALCRQGLLQIFHDYCLKSRSNCSVCPLPGMIFGLKDV